MPLQRVAALVHDSFSAFELGVAADLVSPTNYRYTGAGAAYTAGNRVWGLQGMLGVGYEYKTKRVE